MVVLSQSRAKFDGFLEDEQNFELSMQIIIPVEIIYIEIIDY